MPRSKGTRARQKMKANLSDSISSNAQEAANHRLTSIVRSVANHPLYLAVGIFLTLFGIWQGVVPAFSQPEITLTGSDPSSPFVFPFQVRNQSWALAMQNVAWECKVIHMEIPQATLDDVTIIKGGRDGGYRIAPDDVDNYNCNVMNPGIPVRSLSMVVQVKYTTAYLWRRSYKRQFTWLADGRNSRWIVGKPAH